MKVFFYVVSLVTLLLIGYLYSVRPWYIPTGLLLLQLPNLIGIGKNGCK
jgi:hypothetical protein